MEDKNKVLQKDNPATFNAHVPEYLLKEIRKQQEIYPQLKPSMIIRNILHLYYFDSNLAEWLPQDKEEVHKEKEASPPSKRMKKNRQSFK